MDRRVLPPDGVRLLLSALREDGYRIVAPALRTGTVTFTEIDDLDELAVGVALEAGPGRARTVSRDDDALFGAIGGPDSMKRWVHPPDRRVWSGTRVAEGIIADPAVPPADPVAFIGMRACDLAGASVLVRSLGRPLSERDVIVAVQCTTSLPTCFCTTMGTGPAVADGTADIVLTEVFTPDHLLVADHGTERGRLLLDRLGAAAAEVEVAEFADRLVADLAAGMTVAFDPAVARRALAAPSGAGWSEVAARCLACGNCTAVCPTCFCTSTYDRTDPTATTAQRGARWDSCFTFGFAELHGGTVRTTTAARYRQWATHKFSWWWDQFGTAGCVGCGRCIVWCPAGIDIREEVSAAIERSPVHA